MAAIQADDILKCIVLNENNRIPMQISLKFVPRNPIDNKPALVQTKVWHRRPSSLMRMCDTRGRWVKWLIRFWIKFSNLMLPLGLLCCADAMLTRVLIVMFFNPLAPVRCGNNSNSVISEHMYRIKLMITTCDIALRYRPTTEQLWRKDQDLHGVTIGHSELTGENNRRHFVDATFKCVSWN